MLDLLFLAVMGRLLRAAWRFAHDLPDWFDKDTQAYLEEARQTEREKLIQLAQGGERLPRPSVNDWERSVAPYRKYPLPRLVARITK
jgi:hypothetical protein